MGIYKKVSDKKGFCPVVMADGFKCAYITHSSDYSFGSVTLMKRHNLTDEVFVLLEGKAVMLTLSDDGFVKTPLEQNVAFTVEKGTYHYLATTEDANVFVCERADTGAANTDCLTLKNPYIMEEQNV